MLTTPQQEDARMEKQQAGSEKKAQEVQALLQG